MALKIFRKGWLLLWQGTKKLKFITNSWNWLSTFLYFCWCFSNFLRIFVDILHYLLIVFEIIIFMLILISTNQYLNIHFSTSTNKQMNIFNKSTLILEPFAAKKWRMLWILVLLMVCLACQAVLVLLVEMEILNLAALIRSVWRLLCFKCLILTFKPSNEMEIFRKLLSKIFICLFMVLENQVQIILILTNLTWGLSF